MYAVFSFLCISQIGVYFSRTGQCILFSFSSFCFSLEQTNLIKKSFQAFSFSAPDILFIPSFFVYIRVCVIFYTLNKWTHREEHTHICVQVFLATTNELFGYKNTYSSSFFFSFFFLNVLFMRLKWRSSRIYFSARGIY